MKVKGKLFSGVVLGFLIGLTIVLYTLPFFLSNLTFWRGFIACMVFVFFLIILLYIWNKQSFTHRFFGKNPGPEVTRNASELNSSKWVLTLFFVGFGALTIGFLIFKQNELFKSQNNYQKAFIEKQVELIASVRKSSMVNLLSNILDKIDYELKQNPERSLSDETIARIAALSHYFAPEPYNYVERDSLTELSFSQERGQLLLILSHMHIDSVSFGKIKQKTSFAKADLRGADLQRTNLCGVDLMSANLRNADLKGAILKEADLRGANLWGANLSNANLNRTALNRADLRWADLDEADLRNADLKGCNLRSAKLRNAELSSADVQWVDLSGAILIESNLSGVNMFGTNLKKANLRKVNLTNADLRRTNLSETILNGADLRGALLNFTGVPSENWLNQLNTWQVVGAKEIKEQYEIVDDISGQAKYSLEIIED